MNGVKRNAKPACDKDTLPRGRAAANKQQSVGDCEQFRGAAGNSLPPRRDRDFPPPIKPLSATPTTALAGAHVAPPTTPNAERHH